MRKLIVITPPYFFPDEAPLLARLFEEGMTRLHLRKPDCSLPELERLLDRIPSAYYPHIISHDHFGLATERKLGGIHLNRRNPFAPTNHNGSVSRSCHSLEEVNLYKSSCDYVFLSPIFQSISKEGYGSGFPLGKLREAGASGQIDSKVIALGGISDESIARLNDIPFGGFAILGALWGKDPSLQEADHIVRQFNKLRLWL